MVKEAIIEKLQARKRKIEAKIKELKTNKKKKSKAEIKRAEKIKKLVGEFYFAKKTKEELAKEMNEFLKKNSERKLFDLPPANKVKAKSK